MPWRACLIFLSSVQYLLVEWQDLVRVPHFRLEVHFCCSRRGLRPRTFSLHHGHRLDLYVDVCADIDCFHSGAQFLFSKLLLEGFFSSLCFRFDLFLLLLNLKLVESDVGLFVELHDSHEPD